MYEQSHKRNQCGSEFYKWSIDKDGTRRAFILCVVAYDAP